MFQRSSLTKLACLMVAGVGLATMSTAPSRVFAEPSAAESVGAVAVSRESITEMAGVTAMLYDKSISRQEIVARGEADANSLGLPYIKTMAAANLLLVRATPEEVKAALALRENLPFTSVQSTYAVDGDVHPDSLIAFTGNVLVRFGPDVSEGAKQAFYSANKLARLAEYSDGSALLKTDRKPDLQMIAYAEELQSRNPIAERVIFEFGMTGQPTQASDSLQITDPLFSIQWPLFNPSNDVDLDAPRAWMMNRRNGKNPYGSAGITVGIFDSGTDLTHPDLAANIHPDVGQNYTGAGQPTPAPSVIGAHGTAMAGIVAAKANSYGMVGVAPDVRIFTYRVFTQDFTTTNAQIVSALNHSLFQGIDINLHPYVIPFSCTQEMITADMNQALRESTESGRFGIGTTNFAAAGNFSSQVEFPAQSMYAVAVGAQSSNDTGVSDSNWGGTGVDIVMPGYGSGGGNNFVVTDVAGSAGADSGDHIFVSLTSPDARFLGTSVSSAFAAGAAALLLGDERYAGLPPFFDTGSTLSRANRRDRYPENGATLLGQMVRFADLPGGPFSFIDQYNEKRGAGRPNPAKALANPTQPTRDTIFTDLMEPTPFYSVNFMGASAPVGAGFGSSRAGLAKGWHAQGDVSQTGFAADPGNNLQTNFEGLGPDPLIISPYLSPIKTVYFEDETFVAPPDEMFYVWTDSHTTSVAVDLSGVGENLRYNPRGTYRRNTPITLRGPDLPSEEFAVPSLPTGVPLVMEIQLAHELGVENSSSPPVGVRGEIDPLNVEMVINGEFAVPIATITGDSTNLTKRRLCAPLSFTEINQPPIVGNFPNWQNLYNPHLPENEMIVRTYRFVVPAIPEGTEKIHFQLTLQPGSSVLPHWRQTAPGPPPVFEQMRTMYRDHQGFVFTGMQVSAMLPEVDQYMRRSQFLLAGQGSFPAWSASRNDILVSQQNPAARNWLTIVSPVLTYLSNRTTLDSQAPYLPNQLVRLNERVTGVRAHGGSEFILVTTNADDGTGSLYMTTTDGVNLTKIADAQGARDPSWGQLGNQIVFATPDSIRFLSSTSLGWKMETILTSADAPFLTDFRTPVIDPSGGFIIFSARSTASGSKHNIYMATRNGRVVSILHLDPQGPMLPGWEGVDMYDLDLSFSGRRLIFVANASNFPDDENSASPSNLAAIYSIDNLHHVLQNGNNPSYSKVEFAEFDPEFVILSARHPRLANEGQPRVVYQAYSGSVGIDLDVTTAPDPFLAVQRISNEYTGPPEENNDPAPITPTPPPSGTPAPPDDSRVSLIGDYTFDFTAEGWTFHTASPTIPGAVSDFIPLANETGGLLQIRGAGTSSSFGFWESNQPALQAQPNSLYLYRAFVRAHGNTPTSQVPWIRLRANSRSFESAFASETGSVGDLSLTPATVAARSLDLLFRPPTELKRMPVDQRTYTVALDLKHTSGDDDPSGGFLLEKVELYRMDEVGKYYALWCFGVPSGGAFVTLNTRGAAPIEGEISMHLRSCCFDVTSGVSCQTGSSMTGVNFEGFLNEGNYTVVVSSTVNQNLSLDWNSSVSLLPVCPDPCSPVMKTTQYEEMNTACSTSTPLAGFSSSNTKAVFYDGTGFFGSSPCDPSPTNTVVKRAQTIFAGDLSSPSERAKWYTGGAPGVFSMPEFLHTETALAMIVQNPTNTFGFWTLDDPQYIPRGSTAVDPFMPALAYRVTFRVANNYEPASNKVPVIRVRLSTGDFQRTVEAILEPGEQGYLSPSIGNPRDMTAYMVLESVPDFSHFILGFDLISSFASKPITTNPIELQSVRVERVWLKNYPAR